MLRSVSDFLRLIIIIELTYNQIPGIQIVSARANSAYQALFPCSPLVWVRECELIMPLQITPKLLCNHNNIII